MPTQHIWENNGHYKFNIQDHGGFRTYTMRYRETLTSNRFDYAISVTRTLAAVERARQDKTEQILAGLVRYLDSVRADREQW